MGEATTIGLELAKQASRFTALTRLGRRSFGGSCVGAMC
jgi:hypothetical protein